MTVRVLPALLVGLALGIGAAALSGRPLAIALAREPIGTLWPNAIRMIVIPLVVALVITGVAEHADWRRIGRMGGLAAPAFAGPTRLDAARRDPVVRLFQAVSETMLTIVRWALAVALGAPVGPAAAGALVHYILTLSPALLA